MTRENVLELLASSGKKIEDCVGNCEVETGRLLGADYIVSSRLTKVGTRYKLTLRMHRTRDAALISTAAASGESVNQLDDSVASSVEDLVAPLGPAPLSTAAQGGGTTVLVVKSNPAGASIWIDGKASGAAPLALDRLRPGKHRVTARLDNYLPAEREVSVEADRTVQVELSLERLRGSLSIVSTEAVVCAVAGEKVRVEAGSVRVVRAPAGPLEVRCEGEGLEPVSQQAVVQLDRMNEVRFAPRRDSGITLVLQPDHSYEKWELRASDSKSPACKSVPG